MSNIEIKHLFKLNRIPENDYKIFFMIFYVPLGIILFLLRTVLIILLFILGNILSDTLLVQKFLNKLACLSLGIFVTVENPEIKENVDVYISNSVSIFDHLAVQNATGSVTPSIKNSMVKSRGFGARYFGSQLNLELFKKNITQWISEYKIPINFAPEGKMTNGKAVIKFKTFPFQISTKVQPVCIRIERPILDISVNTLGASHVVDIMFYMFSPFTNYSLKFLPSLENKNESPAEFAEIVRQNIAASLNVETPNYSAADLLEFEKRVLAEEQNNAQNHNRGISSGTNPTRNFDIHRMSAQVKEVLPHVPLKAIYSDLCLTKNVDTTITNILEGRVHFTPEQIPSTSTPQPSTSSSALSNSSATMENGSGSKVMFNTAASTFPKSASERNKSFQERKEQLIANARRRYIEKHNLNIPS